MTETTLFDHEYDADPETAATLLAALAGDLRADDAVHLAGGGRTIELGVADDITVDVGIETEGDPDDPDAVELEVELDWAVDGDDVTVRGGESETEADGESETTSAEEPDPGVETQVAVDPGSVPGVRPSQARFELYRDRAAEWRWRLRHRNGNIIADGGEGYARRASAENGLASVMANAPGAEVVVVDEEE